MYSGIKHTPLQTPPVTGGEVYETPDGIKYTVRYSTVTNTDDGTITIVEHRKKVNSP